MSNAINAMTSSALYWLGCRLHVERGTWKNVECIVDVDVLELLLHHVVCHVVCSTAVESVAYTINALGQRVNLTRHATAAAAAAATDADDDDDDDERLMFNRALVTSADMMATDGVVHIVDQVIVPYDGL